MCGALRRQRTADESGATAVEYGLLLALIAAVLVSAVLLIGTLTRTLFTDSCERMLTGGVSRTLPSTQCPP